MGKKRQMEKNSSNECRYFPLKESNSSLSECGLGLGLAERPGSCWEAGRQRGTLQWRNLTNTTSSGVIMAHHISSQAY